VSEPASDDVDLDAGLEQMHRGGVSDRVRSHLLVSEGGYTRRVFPNDVGYARPADGSSEAVEEQMGVAFGVTVLFC
jgi:hypothetical protein